VLPKTNRRVAARSRLVRYRLESRPP
jgi:hypothetical protein